MVEVVVHSKKYVIRKKTMRFVYQWLTEKVIIPGSEQYHACHLLQTGCR